MRGISKVAASLAIISLPFLGITSASASSEEPSTESDTFQSFEFVPASSGTDDTARQIARACGFFQEGDNPHFSSDASGQLSAHGTWRNTNCSATLATVTVQLQYKNQFGLWINRGTQGKMTVASGGGAGNRATARYDCVGNKGNLYRSWVDVDVVGIADLPNRIYSNEVARACG